MASDPTRVRARSRTRAWCSAVSATARSAWRSAAVGRRRDLGEGPAERGGQERVGLLVEREGRRLAGGAHDAARRRRRSR